jgi:hypothetical protein
MKKRFKSMKSLFKFLENDIEKGLREVAIVISGKLQDFLQKNWYNAHTPQSYERTYQLINSVSISDVEDNGNAFEVKVFFDSNKMNPIPAPSADMFPSYTNVTNGDTYWNGVSLSILVPYFVEQGQSSSIHSYKGVGSVEKTIKWARSGKFLSKAVKESLQKSGISVEIK